MLRGPLALGSAQAAPEKRGGERRSEEEEEQAATEKERGRRVSAAQREARRRRSGLCLVSLPGFPRLPSPGSLGLRPRSRGRGRAALPEPESPQLRPGARTGVPSPSLQRRTRLANLPKILVESYRHGHKIHCGLQAGRGGGAGYPDRGGVHSLRQHDPGGGDPVREDGDPRLGGAERGGRRYQQPFAHHKSPAWQR